MAWLMRSLPWRKDAGIDHHLATRHAPGIDGVVVHHVELPLEALHTVAGAVVREVLCRSGRELLPDAAHLPHPGITGRQRWVGAQELVVLTGGHGHQLGLSDQVHLSAAGDGHFRAGLRQNDATQDDGHTEE